MLVRILEGSQYDTLCSSSLRHAMVTLYADMLKPLDICLTKKLRIKENRAKFVGYI